MNRRLLINGRDVAVSHIVRDDTLVRFTIDGKAHAFRGTVDADGRVTLRREATHENISGVIAPAKGGQTVMLPGIEAVVSLPSLARRKSGGTAQGGLIAPMPGMIQQVRIVEGDTVKAGDTLVVMEAMKLQLPIKAPKDGIVENVLCKAGEMVSEGAELVKLT